MEEKPEESNIEEFSWDVLLIEDEALRPTVMSCTVYVN